MHISVRFINAFTKSQFQGNSAAVIITNNALADRLMQRIATENNVSETAFAIKKMDGSYAIRWFSPLKEIAFCGHATLATAFVLFANNATQETVTFSAKAIGDILVTRKNDGFIEMKFPIRKPIAIDTVPDDLINGLSIPPQEILINEQAYFVIYPEEKQVLSVVQDTERLKKLAPYDVVVTALSEKYDFVSRYFWPANGGVEDPVTGSIHAGLAPLWAERLNKRSLHAYQASERGGHLFCEISSDHVCISGQAVQYLEGNINIIES